MAEASGDRRAGTATAVAGREAASGQHEAGCHLRGGEPVPGAAGSPPPLGTRSRGGSPRGQRCLRPGVWSFPREERGRGRQGSGPKASDLILPTILPAAQLAGGVPAGTRDLATSPPAPRLLITAEAPDRSKAALAHEALQQDTTLNHVCHKKQKVRQN